MSRSFFSFFSLAATLAAVSFGLSACGDRGKARSASGSDRAAAEAASPSSALPVIAPAPSWRLESLDGTELTLNSLRGKVVVLDFWATWCAPCRAEMPDYVKLQEKWRERGLVVVGISLDAQGPGVVKKFVEQLGVNYRIVMGDEKVAEAYGIQYMPTTFLIDREGRIRHQKVGPIASLEEYEALIASLL